MVYTVRLQIADPIFAAIPVMMPDSMHAYYSDRASHMAKNLGKVPAGQLLEIITELQKCARDRTVLEVACGTGFWTQHVAPVSRLVVGTDYSDEMLEVARGQGLRKTHFLNDDAYQLTHVGDELFDFGFSMYWVSHIPLARWDEFFTTFHARLKPGAQVILTDDSYRSGNTYPCYSKLECRDSFEIRHLPDGNSYEIVKTYFTPESLRDLLQPHADNIEIHFGRPRWWVKYQVKA